jgi:hypothetical protein
VTLALYVLAGGVACQTPSPPNRDEAPGLVGI